MKRSSLAVAACLATLVFAPPPAAARPSYFATFTSLYGLTPGDDLHACGVCHRRWEGTGARNPFGTAVEQQLYVGKTITDAILDVAAADTDLDGFTNGDEITVWSTLPGYSCDNYTLSIDPPANFQMLITPGVPSCLEPKDILVTRTEATFVTEVGDIGSATIGIVNNGTDFPLSVTNYALLIGAHPAIGVSGPAAPISVPVGSSTSIDVTFAPTGTTFANATLRISSDDPDEPTIDISISGIGFFKNLAPAADRAACFREAERRVEALSRTHLKEWGRCYVDELKGVACDTGRRDLKIAQAEARLRAYLGGAKDKKCAGNSLTPSRLDLPSQCGAPCGSIAVSSIPAWADCLVCRQEAATDVMLEAVIGTAPPDLPPNVLAHDAHRCNKSLVTGVQSSIHKLQTKFGSCRLGNVTAALPADCTSGGLAAYIADENIKLARRVSRCRSTTGMLGCLFVPMPDLNCLPTTAADIAADLTAAVFDTAD